MNGAEANRVYEFDGFTLDPMRRTLTDRDGQEVAITAKAFDALVYLVEHAGETVQRAELAEALWPTVVVEDNNLSQTILALRRSLGEVEGGRRYIATITRQGYRFVADVAKRARNAPAHSDGTPAAPDAHAAPAVASAAPAVLAPADPAGVARSTTAAAASAAHATATSWRTWAVAATVLIGGASSRWALRSGTASKCSHPPPCTRRPSKRGPSLSCPSAT